MPAEIIEKATTQKDGSIKKEMMIQGVASTNDEDLDKEVLEPNGYILDHFLRAGTLNYEHLAKKSAKFIIGEPTAAFVKDNKMFLKAKLWGNSEVAQDVYQKMKEMEEAGSNRRAGFSIEGKALARDPMNPKRITKALITACAVTFSPVNTQTLASIIKGTQTEDFVSETYEQDSEETPFIFEFDKDGKKYRVGKDFKVFEVIAKAMDTAAVKPMTPESLEGKTKNIALMDIKKAIDNVISNKQLRENCPEILEEVKKKMLCR